MSAPKPDPNEPPVTDFGFQTVSITDKAQKVADVFHSVAGKYDIMNDVMSFGIHRLWKRYALALADASPGQHILDIAGGTGDLTLHLARQVGDQGRVVLADINTAMLTRGRDRLIDAGIASNVCYVQANAEQLPFPDNSFDTITIAFGLRNVTDKQRALQAMWRVLKPNGMLLVLEFSKPTAPVLERLYDAYSFHVLPRLGRLIAGDAASYRYLAESIRMHPDQETLRGMLVAAGFVGCDYHNLTGGIVAVHRGYKSI